MDHELLKYSFLNYFYKQNSNNEEVKTEDLVEMAQNVEVAAKIIDELNSEGLIKGLSINWHDEKPIFSSNHDAKLTEKGLQRFSQNNTTKNSIQVSETELENTTTNDQNQEIHKTLTVEDLIKKAPKNLSKTEKHDHIKREILVLFSKLKYYPLEFINEKITPYNLQVKINKIGKKYYNDYRPVIAKVISELNSKKMIKYNYGDRSKNINIETLITKAGEKELEEKYQYCQNKQLSELKNEEIENAVGRKLFMNSPTFAEFSTMRANFPEIAKQINAFQDIKKTIGLDSSVLPSIIKGKYSPIMNMLQGSDFGLNAATRAAMGAYGRLTNEILQNGSPNINNQNEVEGIKQKNDITFTFEGILGQNCGLVEKPTGEDEKRLQIKGFKVIDGIKVLRGFAKSSDLAEFSQADENYQRDKQLTHLKSLVDFMKNIKDSAKYLPEVTLVARGYQNLSRINLSGSLNVTQKGELDNLEYWKLTVNKNQIYRIDGNHRLEATKDESYYIPFSIIVWENSEVNMDDEAFLFYFLNSKAKKLTTEENLKGLAESKTWSDNELASANVLLPYIKHFSENFEQHKLFKSNHYIDSKGKENAKIQILNILEIILKEEQKKDLSKETLSFNMESFEQFLSETQEILSQKDRFKYLRENFRCFPQFVFYTLYKNNCDTGKAINFLTDTNAWAEYYKHDSNSFIYPDKMYNNAFKQLDKKINIFVAMPYYDSDKVSQFNTTMQSIVDELKEENTILKEKLNLYPIMKYKAESTDILSNMDKQITDCDIFIADISEHGTSKVNPNVMFELGRAFDKNKFILIKNKENSIENTPFDVKHFDILKIDYGMSFDASMKENLKPRIFEIAKKLIGFC